MKVGIINYGAGNSQSVANALKTLGRSFEIVDNLRRLSSFDKVILPGVGAAGSAMEKLRQSGFADILPKLKIPVLGICLGLQLFADSSEENQTTCLGIIEGEVKRFRTELKVPQIGWNRVRFITPSALTAGIPNDSYFYFVNSYYLETDLRYVIGTTNYDVAFPAIIQNKNFYATQFHPEKSGKWGMRLLDNFCKL